MIVIPCRHGDPACGSSGDVGPLETRIAELETIVARPQSTPSPLPAAPTREPDRVVGVESECTLLLTADGETTTFELQGESRCLDARDSAATPRANGSVYLSKFSKVLTIRSSDGVVYTVAVDGGDPVSLGSTWPP